MRREYEFALQRLKNIMTTMPRQPLGGEHDCVCCRNHAVEVRLILTAENFNILREALFDFNAPEIWRLSHGDEGTRLKGALKDSSKGISNG